METPQPGPEPVQPQVPTEPAAPQQPIAPQAPSEPTPQAQPQQPSVADLQRQLAELNTRYETADKSAKYFQSQFDRVRTAVQPNQPQQDPLAPYVKSLTDQGYEEKDARAIASTQYAMMQPLLQQNQQLSAALQGNAMLGDVMRQAWQKAPQAFADPAIAQAVEQELRTYAMQGHRIDPDMVIDTAAIHHFRSQWMKAGQPPAVPQVPPNLGSQFGSASPFGGVPQHRQAAPQDPMANSPEAQAYKQQMRQFFGLQDQQPKAS